MAQEPESDELTDDDLSAVAEEEFTDEDLAAATPDKGPTFYIRDTTGVLRPVSPDIARQAREMGASVFSEADVKAMGAAPQKTPPAEPPTPAADPGLARTMGRGLLQGFFKQGADEAVGGIARAATDVGPGARYRMPDGTMRPIQSGGDLYRAVRDTEREIERGARENRPVMSFVSNLAGDVASDAALSALGVPVVSTPYQVASGALSGLLGSDAELSTDAVTPEAMRSAAGSTAIGAGLGYVMPKVGTAISRALPGALARLRSGFESKALDKARKVLTAGSGQLARRKPVSDAAAREALDSGAIPIWGTTGGAFERLKETAEIRGKTYADILEELQAAGVEGPQVEALAQRLAAEGADRRANTGANKSIAGVFEGEAENIRAVAPRERVPVPTEPGATVGGPPATVERVRPNLPLAQAERIKRALQKDAKYDKIQATGLDEAKQEVASMYREAIEQAVDEAGAAAPPGSEVASLAERFVPTKRQLAATIEARDAAERGAGAAAHRVGGAAGVNLFDVANASQASGTKGLPALALAGAGRIWKERGPSTLANLYDLSAEAAGNLSRATRTPAGQSAVANYLVPASARQIAGSDTVERALAEYLMRRDAQGGR